VTSTIRATIYQTPSLTEFEFLEDVVVQVDDGLITSITPESEFSGTPDISLAPNTVLVPGFIDLHVHAPQWPQLGTGYDLPLDEWLFDYTFPLEAKCADIPYAQNVWDSLVPGLLANGTTSAVYYSSIHVEATTALAATCVRHGQRAWVGRTAMDHPDGTPDYYRDASAAEGVAASRESIEQIDRLEDPQNLVNPIITPRFIPACSDELLVGLGRLAAETGHLTQTHCSENDWEHNHVLERHGMSDTESLDRFGLLRESTVLAHAVLVGDEDVAIIASRGAGIAHCPLSNIYFGDAVFPARRVLEAGVNVGLGTDISGGPSASLLAQAANAVNVSRQLEHGVDPQTAGGTRGVDDSRIDATAAFYLATLGGALVLGQPLGLLAPGRRFDAVAVSMDAVDPMSASDGLAHGDTPARRFEKLVRTGGRSDITAVWVDGRQVA
jgi:guanine deaminase